MQQTASTHNYSMASNEDFVAYVVEQMEAAGAIHARKMFGEYGLYLDGIFFGMVCDDRLFIKPTDAGRAYIGVPTEAPAYPGAKPSFLIESKLEDREWLCGLVVKTAAALPPPKPKRKRR